MKNKSHFGTSRLSSPTACQQTLIDNGADPRFLSDSEKLPIHYAIHNENVSAFEDLLPFLTDDDLKKKYGELNESLLQYSARSYSDKFLKTILEMHKRRSINIDVNETNANGDNLLMIALDLQGIRHIDFIFDEYFDKINFNHTNKKGETFTHKFSASYDIKLHSDLFIKYPKLLTTFNDQINIANDEGITPMDNLAEYCNYVDCVDESYINFLMDNITIENLKINFYKFMASSLLIKKIFKNFPNILEEMSSESYYKILSGAAGKLSTFNNFLEKLSDKLCVVKCLDGKNILHLVCEKNDHEHIDSVFKRINKNDLKLLAAELNFDKKSPFDLLNDNNKFIFENCFSF